MARPYSSKGGFSYPPRYPSDSHTAICEDIFSFIAQAIRALVRFWRERGRHMAYAIMLSMAYRLRLNLTYNRLFGFPHLLVVAWVVVLLWGERWVFHSKVESCHWSNWENWVWQTSKREKYCVTRETNANGFCSLACSLPAQSRTVSPS